MARAHVAGVLLSVASMAVVISTGCHPEDPANLSHTAGAEKDSRSALHAPSDSQAVPRGSANIPPSAGTSGTSSSASASSGSSGKEGESARLPDFESPVTRIEYCDMETRAGELAAYRQQRQYGTRINEEPLSGSDPRYQTVAGAIDAIYRHNDLNRAQKYFPRNICVGVLDLADDYRDRVGSFEELLSCKLVDVLVQPGHEKLRAGAEPETVQYVEARCRWSQSVMLCRMSFADDPGKNGPPLEAFWLARDPEGPTPRRFAAGGYLKGGGKLAKAHRDENKRSETIAAMSASLPAMQIELVSTSGDLGRDAGGLTLWKVFPAPDPVKYPKTGAFQGGGSPPVEYFWDTDGNFWRPFTTFAGNATKPEHGGEPLPRIGMNVKTPEAGIYRLSTIDRMAMGKPFTLDRAKPIAKVALLLDQDRRLVPCEIEAVLVDPETGEPINGPGDLGFSYKIYRDGYLPITAKRMDFLGADRVAFEGESPARYGVDLRPGNYRVDVHSGYGRLSANAFGQVGYYRTSPVQVSITIDPAGKTPALSLEEGSRQRRRIPLPLPMPTLSPASEAAEELLPLSVQGTVTRQDGSPVPNIEVAALHVREEIARTTTDGNGRYQLRFAVPELIDLDPLLLSSNGLADAVGQLQKKGLSFHKATEYAHEKIGKTHVTLRVKHPNLVLQQEGLLIAVKSVGDADLIDSSDPGRPRRVSNHLIAPKHPVTNCNLVLAAAAQLEAEFVDAEGKRIIGGNVLLMDPLTQTRRLVETRDQTGLHHFKDVVTTNRWLLSTIAIGGTIDYLERPVIQLPEPGLWKVTFQVVPSPIIDPANDELWEATKTDRVGNRGKPADGPVRHVIVRDVLDKPVFRAELTTLKILKVTGPNGTNVDPSLIQPR